MDSLIGAAARALAAGDPLAALQHVALRDDPPALALRGIAMAQLGEHADARGLLRRAARGFGAREVVARQRCLVAEAEIACAQRELGTSPGALLAAAATLAAHGDTANAQHARLVAVRRLLLLGRLAEARTALQAIEPAQLPAALQAVAALAEAEIALRRLHIAPAEAALARAGLAAHAAGVPALQTEVDETRQQLVRPAARALRDGRWSLLRLAEVAALGDGPALVVDVCRHRLRADGVDVSLARRPVLFALLRALAEAWPGDAGRDALIATVFRQRHPDETHRARLRVELGRLRRLVAPLAAIEATASGFLLRPQAGRTPVLLLPPIDGEAASLLALLADGAPWSTSALALALGESQRTVQRTLAALEAAQQVRRIGRARAQRWLAPPLAGFATILLLPAPLPAG